MKRLFATLGNGFIIFLIIIALLVVQFVIPAKPNRVSSKSLSPLDELVRDSLGNVTNDSMLYTDYRKLEDAVRRGVYEENRNNFNHGSGWGIFSIGLSAFGENAKKHEYYLRSTAYYIKEHPFTFYSKGGKNYMKYFLWEKSDGDTQYGTEQVQEVPVKITQEKNDKDWTVLFPLSTSAAKTLEVVFPLLGALMIALGLIFYVHKPLNILLNISRGEAFTKYNIRNLNWIGWYTIALGVLPGIVSIIIHLLFGSQVPEQLHFSYYIAIMKDSEWIIAGLIVLLIAKAFDQGQKLQEENSLTV